ncbi:hypothetical protein [Roseimicrobium sp. ORNL1]|uniref:hypothetical protein n=1 Tax=Roseimicrobium sp. ORNL1 TaxID=2711231 RepID=UPI001980DF93|nr:hypothetical protein [Roseimicrobium sp. ORNL1]
MSLFDFFKSQKPKAPSSPVETVPAFDPHSDYDLLSATQRDTLCESVLRQHLPLLGLTEMESRVWVDGSAPPVRRMFELQLLKGAGLKAKWGFSLDFVPHLSGRRVSWHRSNKAAMLDVVVDPKDLGQPSYLFGSARLSSGLQKLIPEALTRAVATWAKGDTYQGMLDIIREIRECNSNCFGFYNYTQLPLAYIFLSAMTGELNAADEELERYLSLHHLKEGEDAKLRKLVRDCCST